MKTRYVIGLLFILALLFPALSKAGSVTVDISNNAEGSNNRVNIRQNQTNSDSTSKVRVETNGDVKTFESQGDEDINYQSDDGKVRVNINNNSATTQNGTQSQNRVQTRNEIRVKTNNQNNQTESNEVNENQNEVQAQEPPNIRISPPAVPDIPENAASPEVNNLLNQIGQIMVQIGREIGALIDQLISSI